MTIHSDCSGLIGVGATTGEVAQLTSLSEKHFFKITDYNLYL